MNDRVCTVCHSLTDRLYGGEGRYPAMCITCWLGDEPDADEQPERVSEGAPTP